MSAENESNVVSIDQVPAEATLSLWRDVLRDGRRVDRPADPADTFHLAARGTDGRIVGIVRFFPSACPWRPDAVRPWQLRGMATAPATRGSGIGRALVTEGLSRIAAQGGDLVWCDARTFAAGFYERMGFTAVTDEFDKPGIGPHVGMIKELPADPHAA